MAQNDVKQWMDVIKPLVIVKQKNTSKNGDGFALKGHPIHSRPKADDKP